MDFSKFDKNVDLEGLKHDIEDAKKNGDGSFPEVPVGKYEVKIKKLELTESKSTHKPMVSCWMEILDGDYKGQLIFMNQVVVSGLQIHIMNQFLRNLKSGIDIEFNSYSDYADLLLDVLEEIDGKHEYGLDYGKNDKGFNTYKITEVFDVA